VAAANFLPIRVTKDQFWLRLQYLCRGTPARAIGGLRMNLDEHSVIDSIR
jgi:hypothetical protein